MSRIGYIRFSTEHQETAGQQEIMENYQADRIFSEKLSRAIADPPQFKAMLDYVREGDTLYAESISRLGRSTKDLLNIIDTLTDKGVTLVSHKENIDTDTPAGKFMLTVFVALSQLKREQIRQRQREGIEIAKAQQAESLSRLTGANLKSSTGNGSRTVSPQGTSCGEWNCQRIRSIAVCVSMKHITESESRPLHNVLRRTEMPLRAVRAC